MVSEATTQRKYHVTIDDESGCTSTFFAESFDDAMEDAADYMSEGDWNADECGTQRIGYTVFRLPEGHGAELGDYHQLDYDFLQHECESRGAVHTQQPTEPECTEGGHDFIATVETEGGLVENPGIFSSGGSVVANEHCRHCGLRRSEDYWDHRNDCMADGPTTKYEMPDEEDLEAEEVDAQ